MNLLLRRPRRFFLAYWTVILVLAVVLFATQNGNPAVAPSSKTVTLLTGQVVHLGPGYAPLPASGLVESRATSDLQGDEIAFPSGLLSHAHPYIDLHLFDAGYLERQGFGDASSSIMPVFVMFDNRADALAAWRQGTVENGIHLTHLFEYLPLASGYVDKKGPFVPSAAPLDATTASSSGRYDLNASAGTDAGGVTGIYLDDKVSLPAGSAANGDVGPALNDAVRLIGADVAHERGLTGTGVKIAVVDTGIDSSHPDLTGKVVAAKNFSADSDTLDHFGHGTHVASIAAGTGVASEGKYQGVAPGAELINAKALNRYGTGTNDGIIRAMEWAADQGAKVINMSLGGPQSDGTDVMSSAVNAISKTKGVLFVIAAGNAGPQNKVSTPAAADMSIAVAAIDKSRDLASFSSRGPRLTNMALKPDISAPGVKITAARANYGTADPYVAFSGTSMASPMVAGSAALVWQLHPSWTREQVKDALLTSAVPIGGDCETSAFDQGAGAVDLPGILDQTVTADPGSVSFGIVKNSASKDLTLQNLTGTSMTLTVKASLCQAGKPDGTLEVTPSQVTIPAASAGGSQAVVAKVTGFKKSGTFTGEILVENGSKVVAREAVGLVVK